MNSIKNWLRQKLKAIALKSSGKKLYNSIKKGLFDKIIQNIIDQRLDYISRTTPDLALSKNGFILFLGFELRRHLSSIEAPTASMWMWEYAKGYLDFSVSSNELTPRLAAELAKEFATEFGELALK